ncbi:Mu transposase domain-containing protein, partial [Pseudomonas putida]
ISVESLSGCAWNGCPSQRGIRKRVTKTYPSSRQARFYESDLLAMQVLPERRYSYSQWVYQVRAGSDYHVIYGQHAYSVPYHYANLLVDLRVQGEWLEILHQRKVGFGEQWNQKPT